MIENIWEGIYESFAQCPDIGPGHEGDRWVKQETQRVDKLLQSKRDGGVIPSIVHYRMNLLPIMTAVVAAGSEADKIRILDFGGGMGSTYVAVTAACANPGSIDYHLVESKNICRAGSRYFKDDHRIHFHDQLPKDIGKVDIVCLSSSIQYVADWKGLLKEIAGYDSQYLLLIDLPAGDIPTYATAQNSYESKIPHWFFNVAEVIETVASTGFTLQFKSSYDGTYLGKEQPMPQQNFPADYQVGKSCNLLFNRTEQ